MNRDVLQTEVLVVGTGGAGLRAAVEAARAGAQVLVLSKMPRDELNCTIRTWGAFTYSTAQTEQELFRQVVETGGFLNNQRLLEVFAAEAPREMERLAELGVEFDEPMRSSAHPDTMPGLQRLAARGHTTGFGLTHPLRDAAEKMGVAFRDNVMIARLLTNEGRIAGAAVVDIETMTMEFVSAKSVVLATGGGAGAYERTDNPPGATGDGIALAFHAGAELVDMECVSFQFPKQRLEEVFALRQVPDEALLGKGAAHYFLGGIKINEKCESTLPGLYAAGEVTGGLFGAARLAGAAMSDIVVFGARAGRYAAEHAAAVQPVEPGADQIARERAWLAKATEEAGVNPETVAGQIRGVLWRYCGTMKTEASIGTALAELDTVAPEVDRLHGRSGAQLREAIETRNILDVGRLVATASLLRQETRGCFWRIDCPKPDNDNWGKNIVLARGEGGIETRIEPAVLTRLTQPTVPRIGAGCFSYTE